MARKKSEMLKNTDPAYADTDSDFEGDAESSKGTNQSSLPKLFRLSSRVASMKRRGECDIVIL